MTTATPPRTVTAAVLDAAERHVWLSGRLLERVRFAALFRGGDRDRVVTALAAYRNLDGGFGEALEPDFRGPVSQPLTVESALAVLAEVDALDHPLARDALDYLAGITTAEGGLPKALPDVADYPHAPWWGPDPDPQTPSILTTGLLAGLCLRHGVDHPWVATATRYCWDAAAALTDATPSSEPLAAVSLGYEARAALTFLDGVDDRPRAERLGAALRDTLERCGALTLQVNPAEESIGPLDLAPRPDSVAQAWFDDDVIAAHLDGLVDGQQPDGGWTVGWPAWTPVTEYEWRPIATIEALTTLRAYGRFAA